MNVTLTAEESAIAQWAADRRNAANGNSPPWIAEQWIENAATGEIVAAQDAKDDADKLALAADPELMERGKRALESTPDKRAAAIAAAQTILTS